MENLKLDLPNNSLGDKKNVINLDFIYHGLGQLRNLKSIDLNLRKNNLGLNPENLKVLGKSI